MDTPPDTSPVNASRYGLAEPATFVLMSVLLWPLLEQDMYWIARAMAQPPSRPLVTPMGSSIIATASVLMLGFQLAVAYVLAFVVCFCVHRDHFKLSLQRIHLATGLLLMFTASVIVGLLIAAQRTAIQSQDTLRIAVTLWNAAPPVLALLLGVSFASEAWMARKHPQSIPVSPQAPLSVQTSPFAPTWLAGVPTTRDRIVFALPLIVIGLVSVLGFWAVDTLNFQALRIELSLPGKGIYYLTRHAERFYAVLLIVSGVYIAWISRSRRRMLISGVLLSAVLFLSFFALLQTLLLPLHIQDHLLKK